MPEITVKVEKVDEWYHLTGEGAVGQVTVICTDYKAGLSQLKLECELQARQYEKEQEPPEVWWDQ
tara:strand:- start:385 stop:579 length:195 start_codon:yes stop_codon:yes gene_type:complete